MKHHFGIFCKMIDLSLRGEAKPRTRNPRKQVAKHAVCLRGFRIAALCAASGMTLLSACAPYSTPPRGEWSSQLRGASFSDMTDAAKVAKKPVLLGAGGRVVGTNSSAAPAYGAEPSPADINPAIFNYMSALEHELYDSLLKPGIQVQRVGTDVVLLLVRDSFMYSDAPEISSDGADTLKTVAKILQKYDATYIEITGYTDSMRNQSASAALSLDMAERVALFLSKHNVINARMFINGRGAARPIAAQDDIGRLMNRRVELRISPVK